MAFDQHLEADRIDGFNLFSAFVRVPLLVLGGILGSDELTRSNDIDGDAALVNHGRSDEDDKENAVSGEDNSDGRCLDTGSDCTNQLVQRRQQSNTRLDHSGVGDSSDSAREPFHHTSGIKRTKRMSWSDERGLPLVNENDESISHHDHSSHPYSSVTASAHKPTKSAMRKSRSIRQDVSHGLSDQDRNTAETARYIPNMNPRTAGNGLIMPTRPYGRYPSDNKLGSNGSEMSPQWGWYINTTPPTPELYHNRPASQSLSSLATTSKHQLKSDNASVTSGTSDGTSCQNQVFQNLQNSSKTKRMGGWTSIPI